MFVWPWGKCPGWKDLGPIKSQLSASELNDLDTVVFLKGSVNRICIKAINRSIVYQWRSHKPLRAKPLIKPTLPFSWDASNIFKHHTGSNSRSKGAATLCFSLELRISDSTNKKTVFWQGGLLTRRKSLIWAFKHISPDPYFSCIFFFLGVLPVYFFSSVFSP